MSRTQFIGLAIIMVISSFAGGATVAWLMKPQVVQAEEKADELSVKTLHAERVVAEVIHANGIQLEETEKQYDIDSETSKDYVYETLINPKFITMTTSELGAMSHEMIYITPDIMWIGGEQDLLSYIAPAEIGVRDNVAHTSIGIMSNDAPAWDVLNHPGNAASIIMYDNDKNVIWSAP